MALALGFGVASILPGCFADTCWDLLECPVPDAGAEPAPPSCDPAGGRIGGECPGIYVSAGLGAEDNPGTEAAPVRTLGKAIDLAQKGPKRVYACAEEFAEAVVLPSGIELWGGLDCAAGDWGHVGATRRTVIAPAAGEIAVRVVEGMGRSIVGDMHAEAADAVAPGGSSIAVSVGARAAVELVRVELVAGRGAAGAPGRSGGDPSAAAGEAGGAGEAACSGSLAEGGDGGINACGNGLSRGGRGGDGGLTQAGGGTSGIPAPVPNPQSAGGGGPGETSTLACEAGVRGADGAPGPHGLGGRGAGSFHATGWFGVPGEDGGDGQPGQGGGGGGGARGGAMLCGAQLVGASGGGGGAGGCGGRAGTGGGYGGASIGLLALSGDVVLRSSSILTRGGGDGGAGGRGQLGGEGGPPGARGGNAMMAAEACDGGWGGYGGDGGHGGGGLGGPSIAVLYQDGHIPGIEGLEMTTGPAGLGGAGADPSIAYGNGEDGLRADTLGFPPP